jgi:hypothetical protein
MLPIDGNATFATERFRFATAATRISEMRTSPARAGAEALGLVRRALHLVANLGSDPRQTSP